MLDGPRLDRCLNLLSLVCFCWFLSAQSSYWVQCFRRRALPALELGGGGGGAKKKKKKLTPPLQKKKNFFFFFGARPPPPRDRGALLSVSVGFCRHSLATGSSVFVGELCPLSSSGGGGGGRQKKKKLTPPPARPPPPGIAELSCLFLLVSVGTV